MCTMIILANPMIIKVVKVGDKGLQYVNTRSELFYKKQDNCVNGRGRKVSHYETLSF